MERERAVPRLEEGTLERREHVAVKTLSNCRASGQAAALCRGWVLLACSGLTGPCQQEWLCLL